MKNGMLDLETAGSKPGDRARVVKKWWQKYRVVRAGDLCACGRPAEVARATEKLCRRCLALESQQKGLECRKEFAGVPTPRGLARDVEEYRFAAVVRETAHEIVVQAHGEYRLRLA